MCGVHIPAESSSRFELIMQISFCPPNAWSSSISLLRITKALSSPRRLGHVHCVFPIGVFYFLFHFICLKNYLMDGRVQQEGEAVDWGHTVTVQSHVIMSIFVPTQSMTVDTVLVVAYMGCTPDCSCPCHSAANDINNIICIFTFCCFL